MFVSYHRLCQILFRVHGLAPLCTRSPLACIFPVSDKLTPRNIKQIVKLDFLNFTLKQFYSGFNVIDDY